MPLNFLMNIFQVSYYSILIIGVVISIVVFKKVTTPFKFLCLLISITTVSEIIAKWLSYYKHNNSLVYHIFVPVEFILYCCVFSVLYTRKLNFIIKNAIFIIVVELINTLFYQNVNTSNTNVILLESTMIVIYIFRLFQKIVLANEMNDIKKSSLFWFGCGGLFYYSCSILIWGFHTYMISSLRNPPKVIYELLLILSCGLYLVYFKAIYLDLVSNRKAYYE